MSNAELSRTQLETLTHLGGLVHQGKDLYDEIKEVRDPEWLNLQKSQLCFRVVEYHCFDLVTHKKTAVGKGLALFSKINTSQSANGGETAAVIVTSPADQLAKVNRNGGTSRHQNQLINTQGHHHSVGRWGESKVGIR